MRGGPYEAWPVLCTLVSEADAGLQLVLCARQVPFEYVDLHLEGGQIQLGAFYLHTRQTALLGNTSSTTENM